MKYQKCIYLAHIAEVLRGRTMILEVVSVFPCRRWVECPGSCPLFPSGLSALHSAAAAVSRRKSEIFLVATFLINLSLHRSELSIAALHET